MPDATFVSYGGESGCYWYRTLLPARATGNGHILRVPTEDKTSIVLKRSEGEPGEVIVYHMPFREWQVEDIQKLREKGHKIIADVDDDLWAVAGLEHHPSAPIFQERLPIFEQMLQEADAITASVPHLADLLATKAPDTPIYLAENGIDWRRFNIRHIKKHPYFCIGWAGGIGHDDAWEMIGPQVARFMTKYKDAVLMVLGQLPPPDCGLETPEIQARAQHIEWTEGMQAYVPWMARFTVGLAPSVDTPFYQAKSPLRLLELQASQVPALCSKPTYGDFLYSGHTALTVPDDGWYDSLETLYHDPKLRRRLAMDGYKHMKATSTIEHTAPQWQAAIQGVLRPEPAVA